MEIYYGAYNIANLQDNGVADKLTPALRLRQRDHNSGACVRDRRYVG